MPSAIVLRSWSPTVLAAWLTLLHNDDGCAHPHDLFGPKSASKATSRASSRPAPSNGVMGAGAGCVKR